MTLYDEALADIQEMDEETLRAELLKYSEQRAARAAKQAEKLADPAEKEKRKQYAKKYREENPERFLEKRKEYMSRPEVKERHKAYMQKRNARIKAIIARAKELGIEPGTDEASA